MANDLEQLTKRYGSKHDYAALTERQRALLLHSSIRDHKDVTGEQTVHVRAITRQPDGTSLELSDYFTFTFRRSSPGSAEFYARARFPAFEAILGVAATSSGDGKGEYLFDLPDHSCVRVWYDCVKDAV